MGEFILKLEPDEKIVYEGKKLGEETVQALLKVTNPTKERQICKVKCTSNEMFRIRPPVFALKGEEEITVKLTFNAGKTVPDSGRHYFAVYYIKGNDDSKAPRACWKEHKGDADGTRRLFVDFKKRGDEEKEDEKDGNEKKDEEEEKKEHNKEDRKGEKEEEKKEGNEKEEKNDAEKKADEKKKEEEKNDGEKVNEKEEEQKKEGDKKDERKEGEKEEEKKDDDNKNEEKK